MPTTLAKQLMPEFDLEMATMRRYLERAPEGRNDWRPHAKSMPLGRLVTHLAELPGWATNTLTKTELDITPPDGRWVPCILATRKENLELFDLNVRAARAALAEAPDEAFAVPWTLKGMGRVFFTMPRMDVYRRMVLNHTVHHRAQLGVYYRLLDIPVPGAYGPTADEAPMLA